MIPPTLCHIGLADKAIYSELLAAIQAWRTAVNVEIRRENEISVARMLPESNCLRLAARINSLDDSHTLRCQASVFLNLGTLKLKLRPKLSKRLVY